MWKKTLRVYERFTKEETQKLFAKAMDTLRRMEQALSDQLNQTLNATNLSAAQGDVNAYNLYSLRSLVSRQHLVDGTWATRMMTGVRQSMIQYNHVGAQTIHLTIDNVNLTKDQFRSLVAAIGLLFPMCFNHNFGFVLNVQELDIIQRAAIDYLQECIGEK